MDEDNNLKIKHENPYRKSITEKIDGAFMLLKFRTNQFDPGNHYSFFIK